MIGKFLLFAIIVAATAVSAADTANPNGVASFETNIGTHYTTSDGFTLYVYDVDSNPLQSKCVNECADAWPPFSPEPRSEERRVGKECW